MADARFNFNSPILRSVQNRSLIDAGFNSPIMRSGRQMPLRDQVVSRSSVPSGVTPPVKSLTPQLQDSLQWDTSSGSENSSFFQQDSTRLSSFFNSQGRSRGSLRLSSLVTHDNKLSCSAITEGSDGRSTADSVFDASVSIPLSEPNSAESVFNKCKATTGEECLENCCNSHLKVPSRQESLTDDTPQMHRSDQSVWNSYSARNLRSMRHGFYSEDSDDDSDSESQSYSKAYRESKGSRSSSRQFSSETGSLSDDSMSHTNNSSLGRSRIFSYHSDDEMEHRFV